MKPKNPHAVALGRAGGKAGTGHSKRRNISSEQARKAVNVRWAKRKKYEVGFASDNCGPVIFRSLKSAQAEASIHGANVYEIK